VHVCHTAGWSRSLLQNVSVTGPGNITNITTNSTTNTTQVTIDVPGIGQLVSVNLDLGTSTYCTHVHLLHPFQSLAAVHHCHQ
jgi:hypothetical protein